MFTTKSSRYISQSGEYKSLQQFIQTQFSQTDSVQSPLYRPLALICKKGDIHILQLIFEAGSEQFCNQNEKLQLFAPLYTFALFAPAASSHRIIDLLLTTNIPITGLKMSLAYLIPVKSVRLDDIKYLIQHGYIPGPLQYKELFQQIASCSNVEIVDYLISHYKINLNGQFIGSSYTISNLGSRLLLSAIRYGNFELIKHLVEVYHVDYLVKYQTYGTVLHLCAQHPQHQHIKEIFNYLYSKMVPKHYSVDQHFLHNGVKITLLTMALAHNNIIIADLLLSYGADPQLISPSYIIPHDSKNHLSSLTTIEYFLQLPGIDINAMIDAYDLNMIQIAIVSNQIQLVEMLLKMQGINLDVLVTTSSEYTFNNQLIVCQKGDSLLHIAARVKGGIEICKLLYRHPSIKKQIISTSSLQQQFPFYSSLYNDNVDSFMFLFEQCSLQSNVQLNGNILTYAGYQHFPLVVAVVYNALKCVEYLICKKNFQIITTECTLKRLCPLHRAARLNHYDVMLKFIEFGCDIYHLTNDYQNNILHLLCSEIQAKTSDLTQLMTLLVTKYPKLLSQRNSIGRTPIFVIIQPHPQSIEYLKVLHQSGASLDIIDNNNSTILHHATLMLENGHDENIFQCIEYLLQHMNKTSINIVKGTKPLLNCNDYCGTPLSMAVLIGKIKLVQKFISSGKMNFKYEPNEVNHLLSCATFANDSENKIDILDLILKQQHKVQGVWERIFDPNEPYGTMIVQNLTVNSSIPLFEAVKYGDRDIISKLLEYNANPQLLFPPKKNKNIFNKTNKTKVKYEIKYKKEIKLVKYCGEYLREKERLRK